MVFYLSPTTASWLKGIVRGPAALEKFPLPGSNYQPHEEVLELIPGYVAWHNGERPIASVKTPRRQCVGGTGGLGNRPP